MTDRDHLHYTDYPPLPEPKYSRVVDGLPCITLYEHQNMMRAYVDADRAMRAQAESVPAREHDLQDVRCECCGYMTYHREHMGCIRAARAPAESVGRHFFDAGWKACANFCGRDDVRFDGVVGHRGCPQFEDALRAAIDAAMAANGGNK